jgi:hypothetical protein
VEEYGTARQATDDNIIRRMRFACWVTKVTDTLRTYNTDYFLTAKMVTPTRLNVALYLNLSVLFNSIWRTPTQVYRAVSVPTILTHNTVHLI